MLRKNKQLEISFSKHNELYDILIEEDNFWRQLNDIVDFSFVVGVLKDKYSLTMGRTEEFKALYKERYKIEVKNAGLKNNKGYNKANACEKLGITIQGVTTLFLTNMMQIIKLNEEKNKNIG